MEIFETYLGKNASEHESKWKSLKSQGYRFISLSVYGGKGYFTPLALPFFVLRTVLVKRDGPDWEHTTGRLK